MINTCKSLIRHVINSKMVADLHEFVLLYYLSYHLKQVACTLLLWAYYFRCSVLRGIGSILLVCSFLFF